MTDVSLLDLLRGLRFLEGVPEDDLRRIASVARSEEYPAAKVLFREGERLTRIFLMLEGSVGLEVRVPGQSPRRIYTVGSGELVGWSPLLGQGLMTATARTLTPTRLVAIDAAQVLALCHHDPRFGFVFMRRTAEALADRLEATRLQLLDTFAHELPAVSEPSEGGLP